MDIFAAVVVFLLAVIALVYRLVCPSPRKITGSSEKQKTTPQPRISSDESLKPPIIVREDITGTAPYSSDHPTTMASQHIGQRKLFLNELQFMTRQVGIANPSLVVYSGAAPCNKMALLADLFPAAVFLCVDPNPFNVFPPSFYDKRSKFGQNKSLPRVLVEKTNPLGLARDTILAALRSLRESASLVLPTGQLGQADPRGRIFIMNTIYTPKHSIAIREVFPTEPVYFLSDIRTNISEDMFPTDVNIVWNLAQQYIWSSILRPVATMMKWKHPFYKTEDNSILAPGSTLDSPKFVTQPSFVEADLAISREGVYVDSLGKVWEFAPVDFVADYAARVMHYPAGEVFIQPYCGRTSTETRLVFKADAPVVLHESAEEYDGALFYYNSVDRVGGRMVSAITRHTAKRARRLHLDNCNDCALESAIWEEYIHARDSGPLASYFGPAKGSVADRICDLIELLIAATGNRRLHMPANIKLWSESRSDARRRLALEAA